VNLYDGSAWNGSNTLGSAQDIGDILKSLKASDTMSTHDMTTLGDSRKKKRPSYGESRVEIEMEVLSTGVLGGFAVGNVAAVSVLEKSALGGHTWTGIVIENSLDCPDGADIHRIVIDCDVDGAVA
jgi:hypothetical protein